jgi:DNA-binding response OmpR family regulator
MTSESRVRILVADADCALYGLLREWFADQDYVLRGACQPGEPATDGYDVILVDLPFPRQGGQDAVRALEREHPGTPIVALSSNFLPGVEAAGTVARELGVAGVVPKPVDRCALIAAVRRVLRLR